MKRTILSYLLFAMLMPSAQAASPQSATVTFAPPTTYTDGSAIPAGTVISYGLYQALQGATKVKVATITSTTATVTTGLVPGSTVCFAVTAIIDGVEGFQSAETASSCKLIPKLIPSAVVITVT